jgi:hypothetical protein
MIDLLIDTFTLFGFVLLYFICLGYVHINDLIQIVIQIDGYLF